MPESISFVRVLPAVLVAGLIAVPGVATRAGAAERPADPEPLEEVVVTATLRSEPLAELPASVTVLERRTLGLAGVQHLQDVLGLVPNLNWSAGTARPRYLQLRGIGELEQYQGAPNPSVGFLIDGIDFSGVGMPATLFDVEQVEVLRGPQGTVYGANALAGLVSVRTREARPEPDMRAEFTAGDYGTWSAGAAVGGSLGSVLGGDESGEPAAFRLVGQRYRSDGFRRNVYLGRNDTNGFDETTLRGKLAFAAGEHLRANLTALYVNVDDGYDAFSIDNSRITRSDQPGRDQQLARGLALRLDWSGLAGVTVTSTTTFADSGILYSFDGDWGNDRDWGIYAPYDFTERVVRDRRTYGQEIRATSAPGHELFGRASWVAGVYGLRLEESNDLIDLYNGDVLRSLQSDYSATNLAAYGEIDVPVGERGRLSTGVRVERRNASYADSDGSRFDPSDTMTGGHVAFDWRLAEGRSLYASVSRGYKAGGFNIGPLVPADRAKFGPEFLLSAEAGVKARSDDGRIEGQLAAFHMRRTRQQVSTSFQVDPGDPLSYIFITDNAARGASYGLEGSLAWRPGDRLLLGGTVGLLRTKFIGYVLGDRDLSGRDLAHAPRHQVSLVAQYRHPAGFVVRADAQHVASFYYDTSHDERSTPYTLVNLKAGWEGRRWSAYAWVRNAFDEHYAMRGFWFGNEPPDFAPKRYVQAGDPRQAGVTVSWSFD